jgi:DNA replication protein DnaC
MENLKSGLTKNLKELHLSAMRDCYESVARSAVNESLTYEQYLHELTGEELSVRRQNRIRRQLRESKLPLEKDVASFDFKRLPKKVALQARALLDGGFLQRCENVLAFGNPGSGKTHLLCAISQELVRHGFRIYFTTCCALVQELLIAKQELRLTKFLKSLSRFNGIFLDDIGYVQQNREEMEVLFTLLAERYERGSILLSSNLPFSDWEQIFKDPMTTAAAIDRLVHHSIILELNVTSYRSEQAKQRKQREAKST